MHDWLQWRFWGTISITEHRLQRKGRNILIHIRKNILYYEVTLRMLYYKHTYSFILLKYEVVFEVFYIQVVKLSEIYSKILLCVNLEDKALEFTLTRITALDEKKYFSRRTDAILFRYRVVLKEVLQPNGPTRQTSFAGTVHSGR
jgi:hypothetical protein